MTIQPAAQEFGIEDFLAQQESKSLLRFITCGSVDDGKSTLIGRLLYETKLLFEDQVSALERDSAKHGMDEAGGLDFALLVDGLAAEREQGITIDVAYRFFTTETRKFIVADTPGHEEYTRNMATGASTADLAVILVDARKGLITQTRRHSLIVSMLGVRKVIVAINKMDLVGWSQSTFAEIEAEYRNFAKGLDFGEITCIPLAAKPGDNVAARSLNMDWYRGPTLLEQLEATEVDAPTEQPFRMGVQWVNRPNSDFRGYAGLITGGAVRPGMPVRVWPAGRETRVERIVTYDGDLPVAVAGQTVTLTFTDDIDASRGDLVAEPDSPPQVSDRLSARILWMQGEALAPGRSYLMKLGSRSAVATVSVLSGGIDLSTLKPKAADRLAVNEIGDCVLTLDREVAFDRYAENRETGSFILIDRETFDTLGMGLVQGAAIALPAGRVRAQPSAAPAEDGWLGRPVEKPWRSLAKAISWRITGSLDTMILAFLFTGSLQISAAIGLAEVLTKTVLYYGHERLWTRLPFGLAKQERETAAR
jgi:sulfate adenylyltransferase large subunit